MFTGIHTVIFYVNDIEKSKDFYTNVLGLEIVDDQGLYVSFRGSEDSNTVLALNAYGKEGQHAGHQTVILRTKEIKRTYEKLKSKVSFTEELNKRPWGWTFIFNDPDGNKIEVLE
jgi:catechol 2,3-dioxygenase-like lactoylglutathione lyase family enzyme